MNAEFLKLDVYLSAFKSLTGKNNSDKHMTPQQIYQSPAPSVSKLLVIGLVLLCPFSARADRVESLIYNPVIPKSLRQNQDAFIGAGKNLLEIDLKGITAPPLLPEKNGMMVTGFVHPLPTPISATQLNWELVKGVAVARVRVLTDNAKRLRFHLAELEPASGIKFHFKGNADKQPLETVESTSIKNGEIWLPITEGNQADLEIVLADVDKLDQLSLTLDKVNLILVEHTANGAAKNSSENVMKKKGLAKELEYDFNCPLPTATSWGINFSGKDNAAAATALISFIEKGISYVCTGTLLNDKGQTRTPWFATADHCLSNQSIADTTVFEWFYQASSCGSTLTDSRYSTTFGGAQLLWNSKDYDVAFLKLNNSPATGSVFSPWDNGVPKLYYDDVFGVHHPEEDHTMASYGWFVDLLVSVNVNGYQRTLDKIRFEDGGIEAGSSGSGLFSKEGYWKGTLSSGPADYKDGSYSPFRKYYDNIKPWLSSCGLPWGGSVPGGQTVVAYQSPQSASCGALSEIRSCNDGVLSGSYTNNNCTEPSVPAPIPAPAPATAECLLPAPAWLGFLAHGGSITAYPKNVSNNCAAIKEVRTCNNGVLSGSYKENFCLTTNSDVVLISPNETDPDDPSDYYYPGKKMEISWQDSSNSKRKVSIYISKNGGRSWKSLKKGKKNTGYWTWKVSNKYLYDHVRFKVCLPKTKRLPKACDTSDNDIVISY